MGGVRIQGHIGHDAQVGYRIFERRYRPLHQPVGGKSRLGQQGFVLGTDDGEQGKGGHPQVHRLPGLFNE